MGENTAISWAKHTLNFWIGCEPVSPGCDNCYAETLTKRWGKDFHTLRRTAPATWNQALKWEKQAAASGEPVRIFTCSMSDFFHNDADGWRSEAWDIIRQTPHLTWLILTKRHGRIRRSLPQDWGKKGYPNVWLGVSVENQFWADRRIPVLLNTPAAVRFLSCEPLLGPVDIGMSTATCDCCARWSSRWVRLPRTVRADGFHAPRPTAAPGIYRASSNRHGALSVLADDGSRLGIKPAEFEALPRLDWIIAGGESGPGFRPMDLDWARSLRDQCQAAGVAFWYKQAGGPRPEMGRELDGRRWEELPREAVPA